MKVNENAKERGNEMMQERTLAIIKPDGVSRNLVGDVIKQIEEAGLTIIGMKMVRMNEEQAKGFYVVHEGKPFYGSLTAFMSSGPCVVLILAGENAISRYRTLMGATNYVEAAEGTIRRKFASDIEKNVVHGSDSQENAEVEIGYFFNSLEIPVA